MDNKLDVVWKGPAIESIFKDLQFPTEIFKKLHNFPEKIAQILDDKYDAVKMSFDDLRVLSIRAAQNLTKLGIKKGDVVGMVAKNSIYVAPVSLGCLLIGAVLNPIAESGITHIFSITEPKIIFVDYEYVVQVKEAMKTLRNNAKIFTFIEKADCCSFVTEIFSEIGGEADFRPVDLPDPKSVLVLLSSSGTTGSAKVINISQAHLFVICEQGFLITGDITFTLTSLFWTSGLNNFITSTFFNKTRVMTHQEFEEEYILNMLVKYKVNFIYVIPGQLMALMKLLEKKNAVLDKIQLTCTGSASVPSFVRINFHKYFPNSEFTIYYGLTEARIIFSYDQKKIDENKNFKTVGRPRANFEAKILDENQKPLGAGSVGEIVVKAPKNMFTGYYKNPDATAKTYIDHEFFKTGDLGYFDVDGLLYITDRRVDTIRYHSKSGVFSQLYPSEIEDVIGNINGIKSVCAVGIPHELFHELPTVFVVKDELTNLSECDIKEAILDKYNLLPGGIYFVNCLPKTASGKVKRRDVRMLAKEFYNNSKPIELSE